MGLDDRWKDWNPVEKTPRAPEPAPEIDRSRMPPDMIGDIDRFLDTQKEVDEKRKHNPDAPPLLD